MLCKHCKKPIVEWDKSVVIYGQVYHGSCFDYKESIRSKMNHKLPKPEYSLVDKLAIVAGIVVIVLIVALWR